MLFKKPLPGEEAQLKMAPAYRAKYSPSEIEKFNPKVAAVLILFYKQNEEWHLVFTERMTYKGVHSGQISFPGGKQEIGEDLKQTALRETFEEIGVSPDLVELVGSLSHVYIPPSNFSVYPFVGIANSEISFKKQDDEVNQIMEIPLSFFFSSENVAPTKIKLSEDIEFSVPAYVYRKKPIWGATAIILSELVAVLENQ